MRATPTAPELEKSILDAAVLAASWGNSASFKLRDVKRFMADAVGKRFYDVWNADKSNLNASGIRITSVLMKHTDLFRPIYSSVNSAGKTRINRFEFIGNMPAPQAICT